MLRQLKAKIEKYNQPLPLLEYFIPMIWGKKEVKILDVGSGPFPITGQLLHGVKVKITYCDRVDFKDFWAKYKATPLFPIEIQDMEKLTYEDNSFDIVHCVNALDHTQNALAAVKEMVRVAKPGGWVYIDCALNQRTSQRKKHYWDAEADGTFWSKNEVFDLKNFGFSINFINNGGEKQYNHIIATLQK